MALSTGLDKKIDFSALLGKLARQTFVWIQLFYWHQRRENRMLRKREWKRFCYWLSGLISGALVWQSLTFQFNAVHEFGVGQFLFIWAVITIVMNLIAKKYWAEKNHSLLIKKDKVIPAEIAPDIKRDKNGIEFPIAWNEKIKYLKYGLRNHDAPEGFHRTIMTFLGEIGFGQEGLLRHVLDCVCDESTIVLCCDIDRGGMNFNFLRKFPNVVFYDETISEVADVLSFMASIVNDRIRMRRYENTKIVIMTDDTITDCLLGFSSELNYVESALDTLVEYGNDYGVHLIMNVRPERSFESVKSHRKHRLKPIKFYTHATFKLAAKGDTYEFVSRGPKNAYLGNVTILDHGEFYECIVIHGDEEKIVQRLSTIKLDENAASLREFLIGRSYPIVKRKGQKDPARWTNVRIGPEESVGAEESVSWEYGTP